MSISIGGIDLADAVINAEFRIGVLERVVDELMRQATPGTITQEKMHEIRTDVIKRLQDRYPEAGIEQIDPNG